MQAMGTELQSRLASTRSQIYSRLFAHIWAPLVILEEEKAHHSEISMLKTALIAFGGRL